MPFVCDEHGERLWRRNGEPVIGGGLLARARLADTAL